MSSIVRVCFIMGLGVPSKFMRGLEIVKELMSWQFIDYAYDLWGFGR
jgi:hypothetical protein